MVVFLYILCLLPTIHVHLSNFYLTVQLPRSVVFFSTASIKNGLIIHFDKLPFGAVAEMSEHSAGFTVIDKSHNHENNNSLTTACINLSAVKMTHCEPHYTDHIPSLLRTFMKTILSLTALCRQINWGSKIFFCQHIINIHITSNWEGKPDSKIVDSKTQEWFRKTTEETPTNAVF